MDTISFGIYLRALWGAISILEIIDMDAMLHQARDTGTDRDVEMILALRSIKGERHEP